VTEHPTPAATADNSADPAADPELAAALMALIARGLADEPGIRVSYQVRTADGVVAESAPAAEHYSASTMKLPLVLAAYRRRDQGTLDLDSTVKVHNSFTSQVGGTFGIDREDDSDEEVWERFGDEVSLRWLCRRSIIRSSNLATNLVLEAVGLEAVAETVALCRATGVQVVRGIGDYAAQRTGTSNLVTVAGLNAILLALADGTAADPATCREVLGILADNEVATDIRPGLPSGTWVAHKNGWVSDTVLDAALVRPGGPDDRTGEFVLSVAISGERPNDRSHELIQQIAATVWSRLVQRADPVR
jgi:beta-lactamase class A